MKTRLFLMMGLIIAFGYFSVQEGFAAIYKYIDSDGQINFVDDLQSVPVTYRATAKIVSGELDEKSAAGSSNNDQAKAPANASMSKGVGVAPAVPSEMPRSAGSSSETTSFGKRAVTSVVIIVSAVFAFIILGLLETDHKKRVAIVRIVLVWGMTVYLVYAHAGDVVQLFSAAGNKVESVHRQSGEKGKKAAKAVKSLNALVDQAEQASSESADAERQEKE